jgi:hypothetical protein
MSLGPSAAKETVLMGHEGDGEPSAAEPSPVGRAWASGSAYLVGLAISCPTFLVEEYWHGKPLIDQGGIWWTIPAVVMTVGFFAGGAIAGRAARRREGALLLGLAVSAATVLSLFIADLFRRHLLGQVLTPGVEKLWLASAAGAIVVGAVGGLAGYRLVPPGRRPT